MINRIILNLAILLIFSVFMSQLLFALINPNFTPIHLVKGSEKIIEISLSKSNSDTSTFKSVNNKLIKGKKDSVSYLLDLKNDMVKAQSNQLISILNASPNVKSILFFGSYSDDIETEEKKSTQVYMHINGLWANLVLNDNNTLKFMGMNTKMQEVWRGGTDMLKQCCEYIIKDSEATVPTSSNVSWAEDLEFGSSKNPVQKMLPVRFNNDKKECVLVLSKGGDQLFSYDLSKEVFLNITQEKKIKTSSIDAIWTDVTGDSLNDMISSSVNGIYLIRQNSNHTFSEPELIVSSDIYNKECYSISLLPSLINQYKLILSTRKGLLISEIKMNAKPKFIHLANDTKKMGLPGKCLLADFNANGFTDILHVYEKGSFFHGGTKNGNFLKPVVSNVSLGLKPNGAFLTDLDSDGSLDVVTFGQTGGGVNMWENNGKGSFVNVKQFTGESAYNVGKGVCAGMTGDINNDGRQDLIFFYSDKSDEPKCPQIYFNRGFRSFGLAADLDLAENGFSPNSMDGQQTGLWFDFNQDGGQDVVLADPNGKLNLILRTVDDPALVLKVRINNKKISSPTVVSGWIEDRCLGAWNVSASNEEAYISREDAGELTIKWQNSSGKYVEEKVLDDGPIVFSLTK